MGEARHSIRGPAYGLLVAGVLLLALAVRLRGLDTTGLWGDQAFTLNTAMRWVNGGDMPLAANKSSVGFVNPPMIEYLYAAALRLWPDILSVSLLTLLGGLLAVAATGFVTTRLFGRRAGLWAMLAFAVAPWAVFWSQLIWNQTMVPPLAALALGGLLLYLADRPRAVYLILSFAAAAAMTQVHPGTAVQLVTIAFALLLFRRRVRLGHVLAATAVFALLYVPYLIYQIGAGWADFRAIGGVAGQEATLSGAAVLLSLDLIRAQGLYRAVPRVVAFDALATVLFLGSLAVVMARWTDGSRWTDRSRLAGRRPPDFVALTVILLWFLLPLLFYLRSSVYLQNYYLVGQWPAHFMILGIGLDTAQRLIARRADRARSSIARRVWLGAGILLPLLFLALFAFQVLFSLSYQNERAAGGGPLLQVRHARTIIDMSRRLLAERPSCRLVGLGRGHQVENSDLALLQEFVDPARVILADGDLSLPLPRPCAVYLDTRPGTAASYALAAQAQALPGEQVQVRDQTWQFYEREEPAASSASGVIAGWDAGLDLVGYFPGDLRPGETMTLVLTWDVTDRPGAFYHFGTYLLDETGAVVTQHDGPGFDSVQWRPGDRFVTFHPLPIPADLPGGHYRTAVALYAWPELTRAELAGGETTAFLEEITLSVP